MPTSSGPIVKIHFVQVKDSDLIEDESWGNDYTIRNNVCLFGQWAHSITLSTIKFETNVCKKEEKSEEKKNLTKFQLALLSVETRSKFDQYFRDYY